MECMLSKLFVNEAIINKAMERWREIKMITSKQRGECEERENNLDIDK
jgi:hypothetical protein